jgi:small subunit ribosomal protein S17
MTSGGVRKKLVGTVVTNGMDKSALVLVERLMKHPTYKKYVRKRSKYMAHDARNACQIGDRVRIVECRPLSKRKRWRVIDIVEKANVEVEAGGTQAMEDGAVK